MRFASYQEICGLLLCLLVFSFLTSCVVLFTLSKIIDKGLVLTLAWICDLGPFLVVVPSDPLWVLLV